MQYIFYHISWDIISFILILFGFCSLLNSLINSREIIYYSSNTDNELITNTALRMKMFDLPSNSHNSENNKSSMKEISVWLLAIFVRVFPTLNNHSDRALVSACFVFHFLNSVLVYLICYYYFGPQEACLSLMLYYSIYNSNLICLWGGVVQISQFFSLSSIYILSFSHNSGSLLFSSIIYFISGMLLIASLFSSASSRKYLIFNIIALIFTQINSLNFSILMFKNKSINILTLIIPLFGFIIIPLLLKLFFNHLMRKAKNNEKVGFLDFVIKNKDSEFNNKVKKLERFILSYLYVLTFFISLIVFLFPSFLSLFLFFIFILGMCFSVFIITYPKTFFILIRYYHYSQYGKQNWRSRFFDNMNFINSLGFSIGPSFRGAGFKWIILFLIKSAPHYIILFCFSLITALYLKINLVYIFAILIIGISPILIGEITKGVQIARSYYPSFIGINFFIVSLVFLIKKENNFIFILFFSISIIGLILNSCRYYFDILPSRLCLSDLIKFLKDNNINKIFVLDVFYNISYLDCILKAYPGRFNITLIKDFSELRPSEIVLIPPTNNKSVLFSDFKTSQTSVTGANLNSTINAFLDDINLNKNCIKIFKTICSSPYWIDESEVTTFRFFFSKDIYKKDYDRGLLRVIFSNSIIKILKSKEKSL